MPKLAKMEDTEPFSIEFGTVNYYSKPTYKGLWIGQQVVLQFGEYGSVSYTHLTLPTNREV